MKDQGVSESRPRAGLCDRREASEPLKRPVSRSPVSDAGLTTVQKDLSEVKTRCQRTPHFSQTGPGLSWLSCAFGLGFFSSLLCLLVFLGCFSCRSFGVFPRGFVVLAALLGCFPAAFSSFWRFGGFSSFSLSAVFRAGLMD